MPIAARRLPRQQEGKDASLPRHTLRSKDAPADACSPACPILEPRLAVAPTLSAPRPLPQPRPETPPCADSLQQGIPARPRRTVTAAGSHPPRPRPVPVDQGTARPGNVHRPKQARGRARDIPALLAALRPGLWTVPEAQRGGREGGEERLPARLQRRTRPTPIRSAVSAPPPPVRAGAGADPRAAGGSRGPAIAPGAPSVPTACPPARTRPPACLPAGTRLPSSARRRGPPAAGTEARPASVPASVPAPCRRRTGAAGGGSAGSARALRRPRQRTSPWRREAAAAGPDWDRREAADIPPPASGPEPPRLGRPGCGGRRFCLGQVTGRSDGPRSRASRLRGGSASLRCGHTDRASARDRAPRRRPRRHPLRGCGPAPAYPPPPAHPRRRPCSRRAARHAAGEVQSPRAGAGVRFVSPGGRGPLSLSVSLSLCLSLSLSPAGGKSLALVPSLSLSESGRRAGNRCAASAARRHGAHRYVRAAVPASGQMRCTTWNV